ATLAGQPAQARVALQRAQLRLPDTVAMPSRLPAELLGRRPDVVAQRWRVEAAGHDIAVAKASFYPNIDLVGSAGLQSRGLDDIGDIGNRVFGVGPALSLPIFDGGRLRAGLALQDANYDAAVALYNTTVLAALHDVADQLASLRWLQERMHQQHEAFVDAVHAADLAQRRYAVGLSSQVQVLVAEAAKLQQTRVLNDLRARALSLDAALHRAIGGGQLASDSTPVSGAAGSP
ncbi:MAG: efflux transporter outer membrane subunit, partial [Oxalobacteraceae bacterium]